MYDVRYKIGHNDLYIYRQMIGIEFAMDFIKIEIKSLSIPETRLQRKRENRPKKLSIISLLFACLQRVRVKIFKIDKETVHTHSL